MTTPKRYHYRVTDPECMYSITGLFTGPRAARNAFLRAYGIKMAESATVICLSSTAE